MTRKGAQHGTTAYKGRCQACGRKESCWHYSKTDSTGDVDQDQYRMKRPCCLVKQLNPSDSTASVQSRSHLGGCHTLGNRKPNCRDCRWPSARSDVSHSATRGWRSPGSVHRLDRRDCPWADWNMNHTLFHTYFLRMEYPKEINEISWNIITFPSFSPYLPAISGEATSPPWNPEQSEEVHRCVLERSVQQRRWSVQGLECFAKGTDHVATGEAGISPENATNATILHVEEKHCQEEWALLKIGKLAVNY